MKRNWFYCYNTMERATKGNFRKAHSVGRHHNEKMAAETTIPVIVSMSNAYKALYTGFDAVFTGWMRADAVYGSATLDFTTHLALLHDEKMPEWEITVLTKHKKGTPEYKDIFAGGLTSFRDGTYDMQLTRLGTFHLALGDYPGLADLETEVGTFFGELSSKRSVQIRAEQAVEKASDNLEISRIAMCTGMYANLGGLMQYFAGNPTEIQRFFDLTLLRSRTNGNGQTPAPDPITGEVGANSTVTVMEGGFDSNTLFRITNIGGTTLRYYTAKLPTDPRPGTYIDVLPGEEVDVFASELGAETNLFLMCYNPDLILTGEYSMLIGDDGE